mmetsp:Transcript_24850/g.62266  ORF Transcript_24850/g.62266 Transcript_24850/m.62266 type:complete len:231 (+) Transcript_24850:639-1331(+)
MALCARVVVAALAVAITTLAPADDAVRIRVCDAEYSAQLSRGGFHPAGDAAAAAAATTAAATTAAAASAAEAWLPSSFCTTTTIQVLGDGHAPGAGVGAVGHGDLELPVHGRVEGEVGRLVCPLRQQRRHALVPIDLHLGHGKVVVVAAKWRLQLQGDEVDAPQEKHDDEACDGRQEVVEQDAGENGAHRPMDQEHDYAGLGVRERERKLRDLPRILQVHNPTRYLLERS